MIKPLIILFNTVTVFLFGIFFGDTPVTLKGNFPKTEKPNTEFVVDLIVNKGNLGGFAKLQLEVPQGVIVKELESKSCNFSFTSNIAKIIWTATPNEAEFTVKMVLSADAAGVKTLAAKYSYVNNNAKEVAEMTPVEITIGDAGATPIASTPVTETGNATATSTQPITTTPVPVTNLDSPVEPLSNVICTRTISKGAVDNQTNVEVKIKKPSIKGFAKFQELVPEGYTIKPNKTNGSSFSLSDGKAKFVWVALPLEDELEVSYILEKTNATASEAKLDGEFSYLENDQTKKIKAKDDVIANTTSTQVVANETPATTNETSAATTSVTEPPATNTQVATNTTALENGTPTTTVDAQKTIAKKEGNVQYCVQVGAFKNAIEPTVLAKKFNIKESIKSEMAEGFSKFMVGNFNEYKQARDYRETIKQKGCASAFVAAYNNAKRITVQEALMVTSQKWFK